MFNQWLILSQPHTQSFTLSPGSGFNEFENGLCHCGENVRVQCTISPLINILEVDNNLETLGTRESLNTDSWFLQLFNFKLWSTLSAIVRVGQRENTTHTRIPTTSGMARVVIHQMGLGQGGLKFIQHFWEKYTPPPPPKRSILHAVKGVGRVKKGKDNLEATILWIRNTPISLRWSHRFCL